MIYRLYQMQADAAAPWRWWAERGAAPLWQPDGLVRSPMAAGLRHWGALCDMVLGLSLTHARPAFDIPTATVGGKTLAIEEVAAASSRLLRSLETTATPKNREEEAAKAKARSAERFGT